MSTAEKLTTIAENVPKVYEAGHKAGIDELRRIVTDAITDNGTRTVYSQGLQYSNWTGFEFTTTIKPNYYINHMFYSCREMTELPKPLDFSSILSTGNDIYAYRRSVFAYCRNLKVVPDLNMRAIGGIEEWFQYCYALHTIELLRVNTETIYTNTFTRCDALVNLTIDGVIGQNGFNVKDSTKLSKASITSIINALSTETTGLSVTISKTAKEAAFTDDEWATLEATKPNWTISLV